ncbi:acyl-CoA/acyl-ACP dehydrogenase [Halobacillus shinanisalinarum]|uniref:Acyl-CoA/acyl-ACP dehydrogenase n=1 Tax=Halobacillus shinanisalinarum TaxID=2932258 RepID=A0ABY4GXD4_9BACI|nr:acyl-CoA dehydrogenase family protein [Halobacillus shinanisalinarum]UOQ92595.1 acyl-CoA/acyl-ACP dehydrogenase [Halobacillus shinanisalinarum]
MTNEQQQILLEKVIQLRNQFHKRSKEVDQSGVFPHENFKELKDSGYLSWTVPKKYGGLGLNLYDFLRMQEQLAQGDGATALSIGWHLGSILELSENDSWNEAAFRNLCQKVVNEQALINRTATEKGTGSPTRGGVPETKATLQGDQWVINGRKSFASMAEALDYSLVTAHIEDTDRVGIFLVDHKHDGVKVEPTWNSASMRGTRSDDLVLQGVTVPKENFVEEEGKQVNPPFPKGWLLHIPACYLGIASAARQYAIDFASSYQPNSLPGPIKEVPEVQRKIGEMELALFQSREILYSVAQRWTACPESRGNIGTELSAVKHIVTNQAVHVVDLAMKIVGARSLSRDCPLERYHRDVRSGLHNPPMDDTVIKKLASKALEESQPTVTL